ncbi:MAG: energy-coupling factor ABC transporter substrate-binding protein [ANME-2 cluster archaeon]|nr:energy-coupling factor ABC transporter substrate-binding protein [ANME-2 cluster archaeon]
MKIEIIVAVIVLVFTAQFLYISSTTNAEFGGADDQAEGVIEELTGGSYEPIAKPFWEPPSSEIESLLFALQAAIGALVLGYFFGYYRGRNKSTQPEFVKPGN